MKKKLVIISLLVGLLSLIGCNSNTSKTTLPDETPKDLSTINPNDLLYTTATLNDALPEFVENTEKCASFHEDFWRQIEFISKDQKAAIDKEILKIKDVYDNHAHKSETYTGYKKVAVRNLITQPLKIEFSKLKSYLGNKEISIGCLGLENNPGKVKNGFFFSLDSINYYGLLENNMVTTLCIYSADSESALRSATSRLSNLLAAERLYFVDWSAMNVFDEKSIRTELVKGNQ